jgi:hypothetical protein
MSQEDRREAIFRSYELVCEQVYRALRTHLGAQHTLNMHRQEVLGVQQAIQMVRLTKMHYTILNDILKNQELFLDNDISTMQQGINEMLEHLSAARTSLSDPAPAGQIVEAVRKVHSGGRGRPRLEINPAFLEEALTLSGPTGISRQVNDASARTVRRRALELGLGKPGSPVCSTSYDEAGNLIRTYNPHNPSNRASSMSEEQINAMLVETLTTFPEIGRSMSAGDFAAQGYHVTRRQLNRAFERVQGGPAIVSSRRPRRREYWVAGPNSLWHHDGQHGAYNSFDNMKTYSLLGLIRWKIVVHMFIDGKSRLITGAKASNNNRSATVLDIFLDAIAAWGRPMRIRGDYGAENNDVASNQEAVRGRGAYIWGRYVHQRAPIKIHANFNIGVFTIPVSNDFG